MVVVLSEGGRDVSHDFSREYAGAVLILVRRILAELDIKTDVIPGHWIRFNKGTSGYQRKLKETIKQYSRVGGADAVVAVVDRDHPRNSDRLDKLKAGRQDAESDGVTLALRTAVGMAVEEVEAWLLADHNYVAATLKHAGKIGDTEKLPDPKAIFAEILALAKLDPHAAYDRVATEIDLDIVRERCPAFDRFCDEVKHRIVGPKS